MDQFSSPTESDLKVVFLQTYREQLNPVERATQAFASLVSLDPETAEVIASAALEHMRAGPPIPALFSPMDEAAFWADMADPSELDAYCLASFNRMAPQRQSAFLNFAGRRVAA